MTSLLTQLILFGPLICQIATHPPEPLDDVIAQLQGKGSDRQSLPKLPVARLSDVLRFKIETDMLVIAPQLKPAQSQVQLVIPNVRGDMKLMIFESPDPTFKFKSFTFEQNDRHDPIYGESRAGVSGLGAQMSMYRYYETGMVHGEIQFVQDAPNPDAVPGDQAPVRLLVSISNKLTESKTTDLALGAGSFVQLCRDHRDDVTRYLRPIISGFDQDAALFAVQPALAWQVLGEAATDPTLEVKVGELIKSADVDNYRQRQAAIASLKAIGAEAQPVLRKIDRTKLSVQQASIVESLLVDVGKTKASALPPEKDPSFLLDVLYNDDPRLKALALQRLRQVTGQDIDSNDAKDNASIQKLRNRLSPTVGIR